MITLCHKFIFLLIVFVLISTTMARPVNAGELRPLEIPNQRPFSQEQSQESRQKVDESVYKDFEIKIKNINHEEKEKLITTFTRKRDEAKKNDRQEEAEHYQRLLEILSPN